MSSQDPTVVVSVCLLAYNHARYIRQALDSALAQQADFPWEICLGEDESGDGTREICREYAARHPERIRLFERRRADAILIGGRPTGRYNLLETLKACRGRYIALLDGDDYWLSPLKLQRQVDFLESHPEIAVCGHRVRCIDAAGGPHAELSLPPPGKNRCTTHDLLERNFLATCSVMYRARLFGEFPPWFSRVRTGDWAMHLLNSLHGDIAYLDEELAAYRLHAEGVWLGADEKQRLRWAIEGLRIVSEELPSRHRRRTREVIHGRQAAMAEISGRPRSATAYRKLAAHLAAPDTSLAWYWLDHLRLPVAAARDWISGR